jgi:chemotaxis protein MotB
MLAPSEAKSAGVDDELGRETLSVLEWSADDREDNWLISYADLLSVIFTMVVLLFGRMTVVAQTPAAEQPAPEVVAQATDGPDATPVVRLISEPAAAPKPVAESAPDQNAVAPGPEATAVVSPPEPVANDSAPPARLAQDESLPLPESSSREDRVADLIEQRFRGQIAATRREHGLEITIPEVALFDSARATLHESARPVLDELAATLREGGETRISVEGHTDNVPVQGGQFASNWDLASARANAVARYLLEHGFEPSRLQSVSYADTRPVASNDSEQGRAANRRVELQIGFIDGTEQRVVLP